MTTNIMGARSEPLSSMVEAVFLLVEGIYLKLQQVDESTREQLTFQVLCMLRNLADMNASFESNYAAYLRWTKRYLESEVDYHSLVLESTSLQKNQRYILRFMSLMQKWPFYEQLEREQALIYLQRLYEVNKYQDRHIRQQL